MGLVLGIVGLPNVGKSTLFRALTRVEAEAANYPFCTIEPNIADVCHARLKFDELWINRSPESSGYSTRPITSSYHEN